MDKTASEKLFEGSSAPEPLPSPKTKFQYLLIAFSMANLCLITAWFASLFDNDFGYFNKIPVSSTVLGALFTNLALLTFVFWCAGLFVRRTRNRFLTIAAHVAMLLIWAIPLDFYRSTILQMPDRVVLHGLKSPLGLGAMLVGLIAVILWHQRIARASAVAFLVLSPLALFTVGKSLAVLLGWTHIAQDSGVCRSLVAPLSSTNLPRVVWIIFDEMDYRFAFLNRPVELKMPELDRFTAESWSATHAYPPAGATIASIPSFLSGRTVRSAVPISERDLRLRLEPNGEVVAWSQLPSLFAAARNEGANCGVVGWYHPYGRLFTDSLSWCQWAPIPKFEPARVDSFSGTIGQELLAMANPINQRLLHIRNFKQSQNAAVAMATNKQCHLAFIHLPIPHKPGIVSREGALTAFAVPPELAYVGNLALVDRTFGTIRQGMEKSGVWNQSWVLVTSDHWWRLGMGNPGPVDQRVPFLLKAPDAVPHQYSRPFNTVIAHDLTLAVLRHQLRSGGQLGDWFDEHATAPPTSYKDDPEIE